MYNIRTFLEMDPEIIMKPVHHIIENRDLRAGLRVNKGDAAHILVALIV